MTHLVLWLADNFASVVAGCWLGLGFYAVTEGWQRFVARQEEK